MMTTTITTNSNWRLSSQVEAFITTSLENKSSLPSKKEYQQRKTKQNEQLKIKLLTVNDFLQMWEDPHAHFSDISSAVSVLYKELALFQLRKAFPSIHHIHIVGALEESNYHFVPALKKIQNLPPKRGKKKQVPLPVRPSEMDLVFLKEYVYSELESKIRRHQATMEAKHNMAVEEARKSGGLFDCQCCFDGDCLLAEVAMCEEGHMFCNDCLRRGAAVQIGDQKTQISCLLDCGSFFSLALLQTNLSPTIFSRLLQKRQLEEVAAAGLEDLVQCPACNFATIMPDPLDKVVRCRNPECGKESCRLCQEDNHVPLTCDEVEKDSDVADRVKLEDAMSEAMIRTCVSCKKKFFKEEGCNMMTCTCGAKMCYICRAPVKDYSHFHGPNSCPGTSDNLNLHKYEVLEAVSKAKKELNKTVKFDPTKALDMPSEGFNPQDRGNPFQGFNPQIVNGGNRLHAMQVARGERRQAIQVAMREIQQARQGLRERQQVAWRERRQATIAAMRERRPIPRVRRGRRSRWPRQLEVIEPAEPIILPQEIPPVINQPPVVEPLPQQVPQGGVIIVDDDSDLDVS